MSARVIFAVFVVMFAALGCGRPKQNERRVQKTPASFSETFFTSITPTADGGAYVAGLASGLWYMRGSEAVKVRFPDTSTNRTGSLLLEITPLIDGGAYAHSILDKTLWLLREGTAERVTEVPSLSSRPHTGSVSAFPLYVTERQKRIEAEEKLEERPELSPPDWPR